MVDIAKYCLCLCVDFKDFAVKNTRKSINLAFLVDEISIVEIYDLSLCVDFESYTTD